MAPKEKPSKKNQQKAQTKVIEDRTFGLKNKNKSAKVQGYIKQVEVGIKNSNGGLEAKKAKTQKESAKIAKQMADEELRLLLNEGVSNQFGKKKTKAKEEAEAMGLTEAIIDLDLLSDSDDDEAPEQIDETPTIQNNVTDFVEVEAIEVFKEKTLEDMIEEQRARLAAQGKVGTPVTAETFAIWRAGKLAKRQAEAEARMKEMSKKKGSNKGLSALSGKELFNYNSSLFVDDDGAVDQEEETHYQNEQKAQEEREEALSRAAAARAQEEQQRLFEIERVEREHRAFEEQRRRDTAAQSSRYFEVDGVQVKLAIFSVTEKEDLTLFAEDFPLEDESDDEEENQNESEPKEGHESVEVNEDLFAGDDEDLDDLEEEG